ncbi:MAG TPA: HD domain-containing phosphohydrolase [Nitrospirota bacterium]|nr:HD domain-containing phosphohydrolase [Nitrospirota bacterium]
MDDRDFRELMSRVISQLTAAVTNTGLYTPEHPQVAQYMERAYAALSEMLGERPEVTIILIGNDLVADNRQLPSTGAVSFIDNFIRILKKKAIERLTFVAGVPKPELQALIQDLASHDGAPIRSTAFIKLGKVELRVKTSGEQAGLADAPPLAGFSEGLTDAQQEEMRKLTALTENELRELKELHLRIKRHKKIDVRGVDDMVKGFIRGFRQELNPLSLLASLKSAHEYTFTHVTNVCILTMSLAESLGFKGEHLHRVGVASLLHDVGKLFIPEDILGKTGKLTDDERRQIETHSVKGARYLMGIEGIPKLAVLAALEHHLKYDGSGYPTIKGGWQPNIVSQIITVADVFDAMRSKRSYQEAHSLGKIAGVLINGSGKAFNPVLVARFLKLIRYQPPRTQAQGS